MAATLDRAAILALAAPFLTRTPAWITTRGPEGDVGAVQSTFVAPVLRGAVWLHESDGTVRLVTQDPYDVILSLQRAANVTLRREGQRPIAEDGVWGPETRRGLVALAAYDVFNGGPWYGPTAPTIALLEWALKAAVHNRDGIVVIPRSVELPALDRAQRVARDPAGHLRVELVAENGRAIPPPAPTPAAPPVCNPQLVLSAVPPGTDATRWASLDDAARLATWRSYAQAHPDAAIPGCPPGASLASVPLPFTPPAPPTPSTASLTPGRAAALAMGVAGIAYVAHVVVRELRNPTPPPMASRRFPHRRLVPQRSR
jgi:hypothetical protein